MLENRIRRAWGSSIAACGVTLLLLSGCAGGGNVGQNVDSPDARQVASYSGTEYAESYAVQGGVAGAVIGGVLGCVLMQVLADDCAAGAALGGVGGAAVGAAAGYSVGRETEEIASRQMSEQQALAAADRELEEARAVETAAARVVRQQTAKLDSLRKQARTSSTKRSEYKNAIEDAKGFQAYLGGSVERLNDSIADVDQRINMVSGSEAARLRSKRAELEETRRKLSQRLDVLVAAISDHEGGVSS